MEKDITSMKSNKDNIFYRRENQKHLPETEIIWWKCNSVDLILHYYHELWSEIFCNNFQYKKIREEAYIEENCGSAGFPTKYLMDNPEASDDEVMEFVTKKWKEISKRIGLKV